MIVKVAVPGPFLTPLDYRFDLTESPKPQVGVRVRVPFRNKELIGLVTGVQADSDYVADKLKNVIAVLDAEPIFDADHLAFLEWAASYYHEPIGEVVQAALPKKLRAGDPLEIEGEAFWTLTEAGRVLTPDELPKNATQQHALLALLQTQQAGLNATQLNANLTNWRGAMKKFAAEGWVTSHRGLCLPKSDFGVKPNHILNPEQQSAVQAVADLPSRQFKAFLLQGVTGSGKTEVYLGMIEAALAQGKQALVLVPEIGLTPQMVARFSAALQQPVATLHSGLNDSERLCAWHLIRTGQVKVLLGTRSAVFAPFANLGVCIIDEEHDLSFKQQEGFRYSARDLLVRRAFAEQVPVVLGSATPSLETLHNAQTGRFEHLRLTQRAAQAKLPSMKLLDIRGERIQEGVSRPLQVAMQRHLEAGGQVLLFLNRRGFAPVLMCHACGWQASCPSCDANMTLHYSGQHHGHLRCHHCGYQAAAPQACPSCQATEFVQVGQGTERLTETIQSWFPTKTVLRIDRDTTRLKGRMAELTEQARSGEADILIGTQMLAKGHHFPKVTLVGLLDIDQGLFGADFRAAERMAQLILQVAGRAGRGEAAGEVLIQTHHPDHPLLLTLIREGYDAFAAKALQERQIAKLPPFRFQLMLRAEATDAQAGMAFLQALKQSLQETLAHWPAEEAKPVEIWGPVSAPMERRQGRYRYQLLLQAPKRAQLQSLFAQVEPLIYQSPLTRKVRWSVDVDPQEMN